MHVVNKLLIAVLLLLGGVAHAERIKDIADVQGVRANQLVGYGLVVGLDGTGEQSAFTVQSLKSMLAQYGITIPPGTNPSLKNVAAVAVHADLPPFVKPGQRIDITISSIGVSKSLRGGSLLMTPLRGADGQIYAVAQGNLIVGGFGAEGADGSKISVNIPSVGRIPDGALVEREVANPFANGNEITLNLHTPDFTTAMRVAEVINTIIGPETASAVDAVSIKVSAPLNPNQRVGFLSYIENLQVEPGDVAAKVIVNSRTGTIVIGHHVMVHPAAVTHGSLTVSISNTPQVSQPGAFSGGTTEVVTNSDVSVSQDANKMFMFSPGAELSDIVNTVNQVGAAPGDLIAILEALKEAGALRAELIVI
jgi:flagellar P-ring protein FlgI